MHSSARMTILMIYSGKLDINDNPFSSLFSRSLTSSTCVTLITSSQYTLAMASESRTSASSWRTVMRYAD